MANLAIDCSVAAAPFFTAMAQPCEAALSVAIDTVDDGVCIGDERGFQRCNAAAVRMLGAAARQELQGSVEDLVGRFRLRRALDGPLLSANDSPFMQALRGDSTEVELWATQPGNGRDVLLRCTASPVWVHGLAAGLVAVFSDLSDRLRLDRLGCELSRVETALEHRNAERRALLDGVREFAIFTLSPAGRIQTWHEAAALMKGYTAEQAIGMPFEALFTAADRAAGRPAQALAAANATGEYSGEGPRLRKDGSTFDAAVVLTPLRGPRGELWGYLEMTRDISARKRLEREREDVLQTAQAARAEAERLSHAKDEFLATISHELRTPLSAILGWAQVLERGAIEPETLRHGLAAISRNARNQVRLIEDLLDMNRIEAGLVRLDLQCIEIGTVIAAAVDAALPAASAKGVGMRTVLGPGAATVMGDSVRLQQVVGNLLNNAIKFTPGGGQISVTVSQSGASVRIAVADTGCGIEPAFLARVFKRFQQQDATTTRRHGGLGLGLSIARHIVERHGGTVSADSLGPGFGATFTVVLAAVAPAAKAPLQTADGAPPAAAEPLQRLDGVVVLLVDDEDDAREVTARLLHDAGAQVHTAASAAAGLALLRQTRPAVLLSDIGMAVADGYDLIRAVRELPAAEGGAIPAAAFTAYTRPADHQRSLAAGYQMHLVKPMHPAQLLRAVAGLAGLAAQACLAPLEPAKTHAPD